MAKYRTYNNLTNEQKIVFDWSIREQAKKGLTPDRKDALHFVYSLNDEQIKDIITGLYYENRQKYNNVVDGIEYHRIGVLSDTHIGSVYTPDEWVTSAIADLQNKGCECILHCGDLTEGIKMGRVNKQMYEFRDGVNSYPTMRDLSIELLKGLQIPMYIISGNHDMFFDYDCNIVKDVCDRMAHVHYLGHDSAVMKIGGINIELFHGGDGFSNVRLQKLADSEKLEHNNIKLFLTGHCHKFEIKYLQYCYCVHVPSVQQRSGWMRGKRLLADTGYLIIDFATRDGLIKDISFNYIPL